MLGHILTDFRQKSVPKIISILIRTMFFIISIVLFWTILSNFDLNSFINIFSVNNIAFIILAALCLILSVFIRSMRWNYLINFSISKTPQSNNPDNFWNYLFSLVLNLLIPFRLGEIYRILTSGGAEKSLIKNSLCIFIEKFFDILIIVGGLVLYLVIFGADLPEQYEKFISGGLGILALLLFVIILFLLLGKRIRSFSAQVNEIEKYKSTSERLFFWQIIFLSSCFTWALEVVKFFAIWYCLGHSIMTTLPLLAFFLATLSLGIPGAPAAIGTFHYAVILATIPFGTKYADALNYAVTVHLSYLLVLILTSVIIFILFGLPSGMKNSSIKEIIFKKIGLNSYE
jgi:glycosyltransferase 2 family protein